MFKTKTQRLLDFYSRDMDLTTPWTVESLIESHKRISEQNRALRQREQRVFIDSRIDGLIKGKEEGRLSSIDIEELKTLTLEQILERVKSIK